jgi:hypothetical protein
MEFRFCKHEIFGIKPIRSIFQFTCSFQGHFSRLQNSTNETTLNSELRTYFTRSFQSAFKGLKIR